MSLFWKRQLAKMKADLLEWSVREICRVTKDDRAASKVKHILEPDLLRASGPLRHMGVTLDAYVGKGYDCATAFEFLAYPEYRVPVEIKKESQNFKYQQQKYGKDAVVAL